MLVDFKNYIFYSKITLKGDTKGLHGYHMPMQNKVLLAGLYDEVWDCYNQKFEKL